MTAENDGQVPGNSDHRKGTGNAFVPTHRQVNMTTSPKSQRQLFQLGRVKKPTFL
jgi:hypothetical protein